MYRSRISLKRFVAFDVALGMHDLELEKQIRRRRALPFWNCTTVS